MSKLNVFLLIAVMLLSSAYGSRVLMITQKLKDSVVDYQKKTNIWGYQYLHSENAADQSSHTIYDSQAPMMIDSHDDMLAYASSVVKEGAAVDRKPKMTANTPMLCDPSTPDFFKFVANGSEEMLKPDVEVSQTNSHCFAKTETSWKWENANDLTLTISTKGPKTHLTCSDVYILQVGSQLQFSVIFSDWWSHHFTFKNLSQQDKDMLKYQGVRPFITCDSITHLIPDMFKTIGLFLGGIGVIHSPDVPFFGYKPWKMQKEWNVQFIKDATGFQWQTRDAKVINIPAKEQIRSGDYFPITRFDGLDQIIQYGTGSHSGHSVTAVWDKRDGELYIIESQDSWYWPLGKGLQRNKYDDWMKAAQNAGFNVAHMKVRKDLADKYDEEAVWKWFDSVQGMPYGYRNFLFSWVDTPKDNFPPLLDLDFVFLAFTTIEGINKDIGELMLGEAMNIRLGTKGLDLKSIAVEAGKQGKTIGDLFAMVEKEGWMYSDGYQYVCSCFVAAAWKRSGILGDLPIESTEFTPRDVYQLGIFEDASLLDATCKKNDPSLPFCQLFGEYVMEMPGYNTIAPYAHMNEHCPGTPPNYERTEGC
jgi:hypothetical protein